MGYTTDFEGQFNLDRPLEATHRAYLEKFSKTRRMLRDATKTKDLADPVRVAAGLHLGTDGSYFVGEEGFAGQNKGSGILDYNRPPSGQPGLWCKWVPNEEGTAIRWSGEEKFYSYVEWLEYLVEHFLQPWGYKLNGVVEWQGEESEDVGRIHVRDNRISAQQAEILHPEPDWD